MPIVIVTGPPGAGKTTICSRLAASSGLGVHLVGDQVFHWIAAGYVPPWMPKTSPQNGTVTRAIAAAAVEFATGGYEVFVDGIIGPWFLPHWSLIAGNSELATYYVVLRPSLQVALARAVCRRASDELVDPDPVAKMFNAFEDLGSFEAHVLDSSSLNLDATIEALRQGVTDGRYLLNSADRLHDMRRLAVKFGIEPPDDLGSGSHVNPHPPEDLEDTE